MPTRWPRACACPRVLPIDLSSPRFATAQGQRSPSVTRPFPIQHEIAHTGRPVRCAGRRGHTRRTQGIDPTKMGSPRGAHPPAEHRVWPEISGLGKLNETLIFQSPIQAMENSLSAWSGLRHSIFVVPGNRLWTDSALCSHCPSPQAHLENRGGVVACLHGNYPGVYPARRQHRPLSQGFLVQNEFGGICDLHKFIF